MSSTRQRNPIPAINQMNALENQLFRALIARESVQVMAEEIFPCISHSVFSARLDSLNTNPMIIPLSIFESTLPVPPRNRKVGSCWLQLLLGSIVRLDTLPSPDHFENRQATCSRPEVFDGVPSNQALGGDEYLSVECFEHFGQQIAAKCQQQQPPI